MDWDDKTANSWEELVSLLHEDDLIPRRGMEGGHYRSKFVFRGMSDASWRLETSLQRTKSPAELIEGPLLRSFRKYSPPTAFYRDSSWELLSTAQHNGLPTRVLDWSISPLIACHFATDEWAHRDVDGVVWCVDATALRSTLPDAMQETLDEEKAWIFDAPMLDKHYLSLGKFDDFHPGDFVTMFEPPSIDPRITSQFGVLSVANGAGKYQDDILHTANQKKNGLVKRIIIKAAIKGQVRDMLDQNNINERIIYPGLPGLCQWLKRYYSPAYDAVRPTTTTAALTP
jgi:hypothetical protein